MIRHFREKLIKFIALFFVVAFIFVLNQSVFKIDPQLLHDYGDKGLSFDNFNNETGVDYFVVPNIVHQVRFNQTNFTFIDYVCVMSAFRNQRPDLFYIHTNIADGQFEGKYWQWIRQNEQIYSRVRIVHLELQTEIFGKPLDMEDYGFWHASDYSRIRILMEYGGIYMGNDFYIIQSLDKYRKFESMIIWEDEGSLNNQMIIAHRNARILPLWLSTYRDYRPDLWYYNGGILPTRLILHHYPELIHRGKRVFGSTSSSVRLFTDPNFDWRQMEAVHLLINCREDLDPGYKETPTFDEEIIRNYSFPFGEMAREVLQFGKRDLSISN